jgi:hypothetical protein
MKKAIQRLWNDIGKRGDDAARRAHMMEESDNPPSYTVAAEIVGEEIFD